MSKKQAEILLVEDSEADQIIIKRALLDGKVKCSLNIVNNGLEAINYLHHKPPYDGTESAPEPDLILLDINMPVMDGKQTLENIRNDEATRHIPVVMLTTSSRDVDIMESYQKGVNAYITKPVNENSFIEAVMELEQFWFELCTLPGQSMQL